jgi:hypothetical protein
MAKSERQKKTNASSAFQQDFENKGSVRRIIFQHVTFQSVPAVLECARTGDTINIALASYQVCVPMIYLPSPTYLPTKGRRGV